MGAHPSQPQGQFWSRMSEDWWAVVLSFALIALVYLQVLVRVPW